MPPLVTRIQASGAVVVLPGVEMVRNLAARSLVSDFPRIYPAGGRRNRAPHLSEAWRATARLNRPGLTIHPPTVMPPSSRTCRLMSNRPSSGRKHAKPQAHERQTTTNPMVLLGVGWCCGRVFLSSAFSSIAQPAMGTGRRPLVVVAQPALFWMHDDLSRRPRHRLWLQRSIRWYSSAATGFLAGGRHNRFWRLLRRYHLCGLVCARLGSGDDVARRR